MTYTEVEGGYDNVKSALDDIISGGATIVYAVIEPKKGYYIIIHD